MPYLLRQSFSHHVFITTSEDLASFFRTRVNWKVRLVQESEISNYVCKSCILEEAEHKITINKSMLEGPKKADEIKEKLIEKDKWIEGSDLEYAGILNKETEANKSEKSGWLGWNDLLKNKGPEGDNGRHEASLRTQT